MTDIIMTYSKKWRNFTKYGIYTYSSLIVYMWINGNLPFLMPSFLRICQSADQNSLKAHELLYSWSESYLALLAGAATVLFMNILEIIIQTYFRKQTAIALGLASNNDHITHARRVLMLLDFVSCVTLFNLAYPSLSRQIFGIIICEDSMGNVSSLFMRMEVMVANPVVFFLSISFDCDKDDFTREDWMVMFCVILHGVMYFLVTTIFSKNVHSPAMRFLLLTSLILFIFANVLAITTSLRDYVNASNLRKSLCADPSLDSALDILSTTTSDTASITVGGSTPSGSRKPSSISSSSEVSRTPSNSQWNSSKSPQIASSSKISAPEMLASPKSVAAENFSGLSDSSLLALETIPESASVSFRSTGDSRSDTTTSSSDATIDSPVTPKPLTTKLSEDSETNTTSKVAALVQSAEAKLSASMSPALSTNSHKTVSSNSSASVTSSTALTSSTASLGPVTKNSRVINNPNSLVNTAINSLANERSRGLSNAPTPTSRSRAASTTSTPPDLPPLKTSSSFKWPPVSSSPAPVPSAPIKSSLSATPSKTSIFRQKATPSKTVTIDNPSSGTTTPATTPQSTLSVNPSSFTLEKEILTTPVQPSILTPTTTPSTPPSLIIEAPLKEAPITPSAAIQSTPPKRRMSEPIPPSSPQIKNKASNPLDALSRTISTTIFGSSSKINPSQAIEAIKRGILEHASDPLSILPSSSDQVPTSTTASPAELARLTIIANVAFTRSLSFIIVLVMFVTVTIISVGRGIFTYFLASYFKFNLNYIIGVTIWLLFRTLYATIFLSDQERELSSVIVALTYERIQALQHRQYFGQLMQKIREKINVITIGASILQSNMLYNTSLPFSRTPTTLQIQLQNRPQSTVNHLSTKDEPSSTRQGSFTKPSLTPGQLPNGSFKGPNQISPVNQSTKSAAVDSLDMIQDGLNFMTNTMNDVVSLTQIEEGTMRLTHQPFYVAQIIKTAAMSLRGQLQEKDLLLTGRIHPGVPHQIIGDVFRLEHVLTNYLSNAIKFSPPSGTIHIHISFADYRPDTITFAIQDYGIGIPKEHASGLFQKYKQIDSNKNQGGKGTGVGLSICRETVHLHGGEVGVITYHHSNRPSPPNRPNQSSNHSQSSSRSTSHPISESNSSQHSPRSRSSSHPLNELSMITAAQPSSYPTPQIPSNELNTNNELLLSDLADSGNLTMNVEVPLTPQYTSMVDQTLPSGVVAYKGDGTLLSASDIPAHHRIDSGSIFFCYIPTHPRTMNNTSVHPTPQIHSPMHSSSSFGTTPINDPISLTSLTYLALHDRLQEPEEWGTNIYGLIGSIFNDVASPRHRNNPAMNASYGTNRRVLIVDEDRITRVLLTQAMEMRGFKCCASESAETCLQHLSQETFDAILMDVNIRAAGSESLVAQAKRVVGKPVAFLGITSDFLLTTHPDISESSPLETLALKPIDMVDVDRFLIPALAALTQTSSA